MVTWHLSKKMTSDEFIDSQCVGTSHVCRLLFSNMHITSPLTGLLLWNDRGRLHAKRRFLVIAPLNYAHGHAYASAFNRLTRFMCVPPVCHIQIFPWISTWEVRCAPSGQHTPLTAAAAPASPHFQPHLAICLMLSLTRNLHQIAAYTLHLS